MNRVGVHASPCCKHHGCKYGDEDCPVELGLVEALYKCEFCMDEDLELASLEREHFPEIVICSAIKLPDGKIFRGHRHSDCIRTARDFIVWNAGVDPGDHHWHPSMSRDQGFITSTNRYVGREEGLRLQMQADIESISPDGYRSGMLFSEDLY